MDISGVIYSYTPIKEVEDDFTVTVQNEKVGGGYVFQDTEDWSGGPGIKIQKLVPLPYTPISQFGKGSIETTGKGSVENASVLYMYRFDACYNPQSDPSCSGYIQPLPVIPVIEIYDALEDDAVKEANEETDSDLYDKEEEETKETDKDEEDEDRLEIALAASSNALTIANTISQGVLVQAMNIATNINSYYTARIPSTVYEDTIDLQGGVIVDNKKAFRSLAQDNLMDEMIQEQYK
jgi:hypothetical protein